jgi:hypothetical protein
VIEWSNFKPAVSADARLRGAEFYRFDDAGQILEIRACCARPPGNPEQAYELGGFDCSRTRLPAPRPAGGCAVTRCRLRSSSLVAAEADWKWLR